MVGKEYLKDLGEGFKILQSKGVEMTIKEFLSILSMLGIIKAGKGIVKNLVNNIIVEGQNKTLL